MAAALAGGYLENGHVVEQFRKGLAGLLVPVQQSQHQGTRVFVQHADRDVKEFVRRQFRVIAQHGKPAHVVARQAAPRPLVAPTSAGVRGRKGDLECLQSHARVMDRNRRVQRLGQLCDHALGEPPHSFGRRY